MERIIKEARIKELLTGQRQFGTISIVDCKVGGDGREHPVLMSEHEFFNPCGFDDIIVGIIYEKWQVTE